MKFLDVTGLFGKQSMAILVDKISVLIEKADGAGTVICTTGDEDGFHVEETIEEIKLKLEVSE